MTYLNKVFGCLVTLGLILTLIHYTSIDLKFQSLFFIPETKLWLVSRDNLVLKFWFYKFPKIIIITYGVILIIWAAKLNLLKQNIELQKKLFFLILALVIVPLTVATLKHYSPIYCPNHISEFGGGHIFISPLEIFNYEIFFNNTGKCSPAGHASGGFALISLYFVMYAKSKKIYALIFSLIMGSVMGLYQIAKGTHYLSDTIITLAIAYLVCITLERWLLTKKHSLKLME